MFSTGKALRILDHESVSRLVQYESERGWVFFPMIRNKVGMKNTTSRVQEKGVQIIQEVYLCG